MARTSPQCVRVLAADPEAGQLMLEKDRKTGKMEVPHRRGKDVVNHLTHDSPNSNLINRTLCERISKKDFKSASRILEEHKVDANDRFPFGLTFSPYAEFPQSPALRDLPMVWPWPQVPRRVIITLLAAHPVRADADGRLARGTGMRMQTGAGMQGG